MRAIDLFCGAGGMSLGFKKAGFDVIAAFDNDQKHVDTYNSNFTNSKAYKRDISTLSGKSILCVCPPKFADSDIDLIFGGPPCQGFSVGGKQILEDERNLLIGSFARIVSEIRPKSFVLENVYGLLGEKYIALVRDFYQALSSEYNIIEKPWVLRAEEFGIPQARKRVFIIGVKKGLSLPPLPKPVYANEDESLRHPTVKDALSDLPGLDDPDYDYLFESDFFQGELGNPSLYAFKMRQPLSNSDGHKKTLSGFLKTRHSAEVERRFAATRQGERESVSRFLRLAWNGIAPTLRAGTIRGRGQFMAPRPIHPEEPRVITVREAARLHSFPDWFDFHPTKWYGFMQIGNSVPPLMAQAVGTSLREVIL